MPSQSRQLTHTGVHAGPLVQNLWFAACDAAGLCCESWANPEDMQDIITVGSMPAFELYVTHSRYCHLAVRQLAARPGTERQLRTSVVKLAKAAMVMLLSKRTSLHAELSDHFKSINSGNLSEADVSTLQASGLSLQKSEYSRLDCAMAVLVSHMLTGRVHIAQGRRICMRPLQLQRSPWRP